MGEGGQWETSRRLWRDLASKGAETGWQLEGRMGQQIGLEGRNHRLWDLHGGAQTVAGGGGTAEQGSTAQDRERVDAVAQPAGSFLVAAVSRAGEEGPKLRERVTRSGEAGVTGVQVAGVACGQRHSGYQGATVPSVPPDCVVSTSSRQEAGFTRTGIVPDRNSMWGRTGPEGVRGV